MLKNKLFWYGNMAGAVAGWVFILSGLIHPFEGGLKTTWNVVMIIWCIVHPLELISSIPIAKKAGFTRKQTIINTLIFGVTWWVPVKTGVFKG